MICRHSNLKSTCLNVTEALAETLIFREWSAIDKRIGEYVLEHRHLCHFEKSTAERSGRPVDGPVSGEHPTSVGQVEGVSARVI